MCTFIIVLGCARDERSRYCGNVIHPSVNPEWEVLVDKTIGACRETDCSDGKCKEAIDNVSTLLQKLYNCYVSLHSEDIPYSRKFSRVTSGCRILKYVAFLFLRISLEIKPHPQISLAVTKPESSMIVGHIPRKMSAICSL